MKVYCIENKLDGKKYIGITKGEIDRRFKQHKQITKSKNSSYRNHIHKAMAMYGIENFTVYQVDEADTKEDLFEKDNKWSLTKIIPRKMVIGPHFDERLLSVCLSIQAPPPKNIA